VAYINLRNDLFIFRRKYLMKTKKILAIVISMFVLMMVMPVMAFADDFELPSGGNAIIGGTFYDDEGEMEWVRFDDQAVAFEIGVPFVARVDLGSETNTHGAASWGFISVVQTDMDIPAFLVDAYIEAILVDGQPIAFDEDNREVSNERNEGGIRISLTNGWADAPVVMTHGAIGEFSTLEVIMAFVETDDYGDPAPRPDFSAFAHMLGATAADEAPAANDDDNDNNDNTADVPAESGNEAPAPAPSGNAGGDPDDDGGFPVGAAVGIGGGLLAVVIACAAISKKKKK
jgi:hypothetical protein